MDKKKLVILIFLGMVCFGHTQNFHYNYQVVRIDSTLDSKVNPKLKRYVESQQKIMGRTLDQVIAYCPNALFSTAPEGTLSNLLTDLMRQQAPKQINNPAVKQCDLSILNFGGIRSNLPAGDVTIGHIYNILPFENHLVFIKIKGKELRKTINRFKLPNLSTAYSGMRIGFASGHPETATLQGAPIDDERTYTLVTIDFIAKGGDDILTGIQFEEVIPTNILFRDFIIDELKNITKAGHPITSKLDGRAATKNTK